MNYRYSVIVCILALITISSCKTPTSTVDETGSITGYVLVRQLDGSINYDNHSISVALNGNQSYSTTSSDSGKFVFSNVVRGIYSVTYSKLGYSTQTMDNIQFVGNGTLKLSDVTVNEMDSNLDRRCYGYVQLYDENGDSLSDNSGVQVLINGTNSLAVTDKSGYFYFLKYPAGNFDMTFSKAGFDNLVRPQVTFPDSNTIKSRYQLIFRLNSSYPQTVKFAKPAHLTVKLDSLTIYTGAFTTFVQQDGTIDTNISINCEGKVTPSGYGKTVRSFMVLGTKADLTLDNYEDATRSLIDLENPNRNLNRISQVYTTEKRFTPSRWHIDHRGKEVYVRVYVLWQKKPDDTYQNYYESLDIKNKTLTGYTASNVVKITLPTEVK